ncbi:MAG: bifunctional 23S rRNA (guanine(2069)-N(7))-methyltransferase RlmK/23S rRNA (guanine(2445)-N(2))-methyltransferase RlmL [Magnetococcales bacterium]|nr:bifunctional 23S rRNA (guanine(2069)-N(7))-methyltransferase RlmK/23S rRNA (guanine(2445)-N(2))-methyltransferase RlmL [Magnetococcales bacterium]
MVFFVSVPSGLESLLAGELRQLGLARLRPGQSGVSFSGTLEDALRVVLWSRVGSRVTLPLQKVPAATPEALYAGVHAIPWEEHIPPQGTLDIEFKGVNDTIRHTRFGAQKVKDAVVDRLREKRGSRPTVTHAHPDVHIHVRLREESAQVALDLAGGSLHRRGYRVDSTVAPLRENLAAAILMLCNWPELAQQGAGLFDPLCGSGTFLIEGAWMAGDVAPGLLRPASGGRGWLGWDAPLWRRLLSEAEARREVGMQRLPPLLGGDLSATALQATRRNAMQAGVVESILLQQKSVAQLRPGFGSGLLVTNPPYGQRLGHGGEWTTLYRDLGHLLQSGCRNWPAGVLAMDNLLPQALGLKPERSHPLRNGPLHCNLLIFSPSRSAPKEAPTPDPAATPDSPISPGQEMFANRLRKNMREMGKWARREGVHCYRVYDADMPEYALAIDLYDGYVHAQEYHAPVSVEPEKARMRLQEALAALPGVFGLQPEKIFFKVRRRQKGDEQYQKLESKGIRFPVREGPFRFLVNLSDYLDVGLFLDHRRIRAMLGEMASGRRFLNLFGYTGTATVYAAAGGAVSTTTVDMSATYLHWARANLDLNGLMSARHQFVEGDCLAWIDQHPRRYDLIFLDPPTFSNSKRMSGVFDVQRDHVDLVIRTARLLAAGGVMIFSNNFKKFRPQWTDLPPYLEVVDLTTKTIPEDFRRHANVHHCWRMQMRA